MKNQHSKRQETDDPVDETVKRRPLWYVGWILYTRQAELGSLRTTAAYQHTFQGPSQNTLHPTRDHFLFTIYYLLCLLSLIPFIQHPPHYECCVPYNICEFMILGNKKELDKSLRFNCS